MPMIVNPYRYGVVEFDPLSISDLLYGLRADSLIGTLSDTDPVTTWDDQSPNGADAGQTTGGQKPLFRTGQKNGLPAVVWDGSNDWLSNDLQPDWDGNNIDLQTVAFVLKADSVDSANDIFYAIDAVSQFHYLANSNSPSSTARLDFGSNNSDYYGGPIDLSADWVYGICELDRVTPTNFTLEINGSPVSVSQVTGTTISRDWRVGYVLGAGLGGGSNNADIRIAEWWCWSRFLASGEKSGMRSYFVNKYAF